ncbi:hypothetical protein BJ742DRAFT_822579 [Cladochytrium replicatum]|nr:hypothetical protein BJ742DRAFT_822579 [Cladochytrium replicatum]
MSVHRPLGAGERWRLVRHSLNIYGSVAWGIRYVPHPHDQLKQDGLIHSLTHECAELLELHPRLRLGVRSLRSHPFWIVLPSTTPTPFQVVEEDIPLATLVQRYLDHFFDVETESAYLWAIVASLDSRSGGVNVVFFAHHTLLDGLSGMQVLFDYIRLLSTGCAATLLQSQKVARTELADDLPVEKVAPITKPSFVTWLSSKLPSQLSLSHDARIWTPYHEVPSEDLTPQARDLKRPFNPVEIRAEQLRIVRCIETLPRMLTTNIRIPQKSRILALARSNGTTLHGALLTATQDALSAVYGLNPSATITAASAGSLRPYCDPPLSSRPYTLGNFVFGWVHPGHPTSPLLADAIATPSLKQAYRDAFWKDAKRKKEELIRTMKVEVQEVGMRVYLPDDGFEKVFVDEAKMGKCGITFEISNLLEWEFPEVLDVAGLDNGQLGFEDLTWAQPHELEDVMVALNIASVKHTDLIYCSMSYRTLAGVRVADIEALGRAILDCFSLLSDSEC